MQIDRDTPICGLRPVQLKTLVRHDHFSTHRAMLLLGIGEPRMSQTLHQLAQAGWLSWEGEHDHVDQWRTTPMGHRLAATRLIRRFPVSEGRTLLPRIVERARTLNADPDASRRISAIILFGSVLTAADDADAGDIDLVVETRRRPLPKDRFEALVAAEEARMPEHLGFIQRLNRSSRDLARAIGTVSNKISLHDFSDIEILAAPHRDLYRYDVETECEIEADPSVRIVSRVDEEDAEDKPVTLPPALVVRPWPVAPNAPVDLEPVGEDMLALAEHLWMKGVKPAAIARRVHMKMSAVNTYLASRRDRGLGTEVPFDINLRWMIEQAMGPVRSHAIAVEIVKRHEQSVRIECEGLDPESFKPLADIRFFGGGETWSSGRCDLVPIIEPAARASWSWWEGVRDRFVGFDVRLLVVVGPAHSPQQPLGSRRPDFRPLVQPLRDLLVRRLPPPLDRDAADACIQLTAERERRILQHWAGPPDAIRSSAERITRRAEARLWREIDQVLEPHGDFLGALGSLKIAVEPSHVGPLWDAIIASWQDEDSDD